MMLSAPRDPSYLIDEVLFIVLADYREPIKYLIRLMCGDAFFVLTGV